MLVPLRVARFGLRCAPWSALLLAACGLSEREFVGMDAGAGGSSAGGGGAGAQGGDASGGTGAQPGGGTGGSAGTAQGGTSAGTSGTSPDGGSAADGGGGRLPSPCASQGLCDPVPVASASSGAEIRALTLAGPYLYFLEGGGGQALIYRVSTAGGNPTLLSIPPPPTSNGISLGNIITDGSYVYGTYGGSSSVARMPVTGGATADTFGTSVGYASSLRLNSSLLLIGATLSSNYIQTMPKTGGDGSIAVSSLAIDYVEFEADDAFIYMRSLAGDGINRAPVAGGAPIAVAAADPGEDIVDLALSGDEVFFASNTRVGRVAAAGGTPTPVDSAPAYALVADADRVFYFRAVAGAASASCGDGSELHAAAIAGGAPEHFVTDVGPCVTNVVQDASAVYWVSGDESAIRKVAK